VEAVGAADRVGVGTAVGDGTTADGLTDDRLTGAGTVDGRDAGGGAGGDRLHAVAPSATTAATAARPRTLRRYDATARPSAGHRPSAGSA
jgi:hypothetical protein